MKDFPPTKALTPAVRAECENIILTALQEGPKSAETLVLLLKLHGLYSPRNNFGWVFMNMHKEKKIRRLGFVMSQKEGRPLGLWALPT